MPRSPLTESIQKVRRLVTEIQGTLTVDEFNLLLDELVPEPEPEVKRAKKTRKKSSTSKSSQSPSKSSRASGMAAQLNKSLKQQRETTKDDDDDNRFDGKQAQDARDELLRDVTDEGSERCMFPRGDRQWCYLLSDHNIHHMKTHPDYHPFQLSTTAPPAPAPSPAKGGAVDESVSAASGD